MPKDLGLINKLFEKYEQMMFNFALSILHNNSEAEDVVQDAFLWLINNSEKISQIPCNKMPSYFATIIEHLSLNKIKKQKNHLMEDIDEHEELSSDISVEQTAVSKLTVEKIKETIDGMRSNDRYILQLRLFEQKTDREISEITGIPEKDVHVYYYRVRMRLIEILKREGIDYEF